MTSRLHHRLRRAINILAAQALERIVPLSRVSRAALANAIVPLLFIFGAKLT